MIGKTLGKYRIVEQIGRGGMAEVYKAYQPGLDRYVAIKLMHSFLAEEKDFLERFQREARTVGRLRHPNIVQMIDFDTQDNVSYMVMEYLQGPSLKNRLEELAAQGKWLTLEEALRIVRDVGEALDYAHRRDMFHRDVKPANIMLTKDGGAILTDFGILKMIGDTSTKLTATGAMVGTPAYMAPEQSMGESPDGRADIYSLGIVLYQLVTRRLPYDADTPMAIVIKHLSAPLPMPTTLNPDLPEGVERVILKALAKDPNDRYQTVREMLEHLDLAMMGIEVPKVDPAIAVGAQPIAGAPTLIGEKTEAAQVVEPAAPPARRRPAGWVWGLIGLGIVAVIIAAGLMIGGQDKAEPTATVPPPTNTATPTKTPNQLATLEKATLNALLLTVNAPTNTPTNTPSPTVTMTPVDTPTPTPVPTHAPTPVPTHTPTPTLACQYNAKLDQHLSTWPWANIAAEASFQKSWRLRNNGDCAWPPGTVLAFISGDQLGAPDTVEIELADVDGTADVGVDMRAPQANGYYSSVWQLRTADGLIFGEEFLVQIQVGPTATPPATATPLVTNTPAGPLGMQNFPSIPTCFVNHGAGVWTATLVWHAWGGGGPDTYEYYYDGDTYLQLPGPSYEISGQVGRNWIGTFCTHSLGDKVCQTFTVFYDQLPCR